MRNLFLALAVLFAASSFAQKPGMNNLSPADKTQKFLNHWGKELALTSDQQTKAQPGIMDMFTKISALRADTTMERKAKGKAAMDARKTGIDGFKAILTPDQAALYDKKVQEMKDKQKAKNGKGNGKGNGGNQGVKKAAEDEIGNEDIF